MLKNFSLLLVLVAAACGKDKGSAATASAPIDVAGVNALVPADLKAKLVFEQRDLTEERGKRSKTTYTMAAPKDWEQDMKMFASVKPKDDSDLGFMTSLRVGSNCDGTCEAKDWAKVSEKVNFAQYRSGDWKIIKDESNKTTHLMIAQQGDSTYVTYAWWADGARKYYSCTAALEKNAAPAADAFAKACQAVSIKGDD
jgi:hypothetical protein